MKNLFPFLIVGLFIYSSYTYAQSDTEKEVVQTILDAEKYIKVNLKNPPDQFSKHGSLEFWSSGGLLQEVSPDLQNELDSYNIQIKHLQVITLVENQAAVAIYYAEGSLKPKGGQFVNHYLTRITEVYVKEEGKWKIRTAHYSPITGGMGTSQTAQE
jgi:hypothetical protein